MAAINSECLHRKPAKLSEEEIYDPYLVFNRFFDYADLPAVREYLWDWLKVTVSGTFSTHMLTRGQRYDMVYLYEHIEKLVEAAHLIHMRHSGRKEKKKKKKKNKPATTNQMGEEKAGS